MDECTTREAPGPAQALPLLDRDAELATLRRAMSGAGGVVLVEGGPGTGKTRLLAEARAMGAGRGLRVLQASGDELEHEHPYGIVRQLYEVALLGPESAPWLDGPAAGALSVFKPTAAIEAAPFATLNGLYWLTVNAARQDPLLLVVDDLHWADLPSLHFLQYLVRRLEGLRVLVVLGSRPADTELLAELVTAPAVERLRPAPLSQDAVGTLSRQLLGVRPADAFADACRRASGGNPLLLIELLRTLRAEGVEPDEEHLHAVDHVGPSALARVALLRLRRLPGAAVAVAQAIALLGTGAATPLVAELAEVGEPSVAPAVAALVEAQIVAPQSPLGFVHPVLRDAVYRELTPAERDRRHALAAELLHERAAAPDQVGAHLLLAAPRGERWIAEALEAAADDAAQRGAIETAVTFLRRAVAERPADADVALLVRLGLSEATLDPEAAVAHLDAARRAAPAGRPRARIGELITRLLVFARPTEAIAAARQARAELGATDGRAAGLLALERYAGRFCGVDAAPYPEPDLGSARGRMVVAIQAWDLALGGAPAAECVALAADALLLDEPSGARLVFADNGLLTTLLASTVLMLADDPRAERLWEGWHAEALRVGRVHAAIAGRVWQASNQLRAGQVADAEASLQVVLEGTRRWGPGVEAPGAQTLAMLAEVQLERGDHAAAQATLDRVPERWTPKTEGALFCHHIQVRLLAANGRFPEALEALESVEGQLRSVLNPAWRPWRSVRAEVLSGVGRREEAIACATEEVTLARRWGTSAPIGRALTVLGALTSDLGLLEEAVAVTQGSPARLEHAKALLALGGTVRRSGRPGDARAWLRDAHELAAGCGAEGLARAARDELSAAGARPRAVVGGGAASLTPSERRVAELAAAGQRNLQIAQQLYLSPKTVEVHLSSTYRKLGIKARTQLVSVLGSVA